MKELKVFIKGLKEMKFKMVSVGEVFSVGDSKLIKLDCLLNEMLNLGIKEVVSVYDESFEVITNNEKYIEIYGVY